MWPPLVKREKYGWRDMGWSLRQRCYGWHAPFCDVDVLCYDNRVPLAIIEDVGESGRKSATDNANVDVLKCLAAGTAKRPLPLFGRRYAEDFSWFVVVPWNTMAKMYPPPEGGFRQHHSEVEHVVWRYRIAGRTISTKQAKDEIERGLENKLDQPLLRSALFKDLDNPRLLEKDAAKLTDAEAERLIKVLEKRLQNKNGRAADVAVSLSPGIGVGSSGLSGL